MYTGLLHLHSFLRWIIIVLALIAIYRSYTGMTAGRVFSAGDKKIGLFLMTSAHITLLVGLYLWIAGPYGLANIRNLGFGPVMKERVYRFFAIEHIFGMLIAIVLITIGRGAAKKNIPDLAKFKKIVLVLFSGPGYHSGHCALAISGRDRQAMVIGAEPL